MKATIIRQLAIVLLLCQMLTSCYSYRSVLSESDMSSASPIIKVTSGNVYLVKYKTGEEKSMKVMQVDDNYIYGTLYTDNPNGKTLKAPGTMLPLNQVADVKEKKSNPALTVAAVVVPVALLVILANINPDGSFIWEL